MAVRIALLSNPKSTGNLSKLPRIRAFCAEHPDIFHYEVEQASQIGEVTCSFCAISRPTRNSRESPGRIGNSQH